MYDNFALKSVSWQPWAWGSSAINLRCTCK